MEENFWDISSNSLPKIILTTIPHSSHPTIPDLQSQEQHDDKNTKNNKGSSGNIMPNIIVSEIGGESLLLPYQNDSNN